MYEKRDEKLLRSSRIANPRYRGARNYDATIGRWMNVDPLAEDFYGASPYNYVGNDPVGQADFDGRDFRIDVIRDKDDNITGLKFSSTVYIQGSGASKEKADELNKDFKDNYGSSKKIDGIDICIDINYVYNGTKKSSDLKDDENLLSFSAEDKRSFVSGNTGAIYNSGESNRTIFHESFHFMGLSDRYDDFTADKWRPVKDQTTVPHKDFGNDIMGSNSFILSNIHYQNWIKHAKLRANLGPIKAGPFFQIPESYIESKKVDTNSKGQLQDKKGNWYRPIKK
jgi:RHS repeat-associated protein